MNHIKKLVLKGFKKFKDFEIEFNEHMNIIVGENEAGKSTILEALRVVFNQQYRNSDKSVLQDIFNKELIKAFEECPNKNNLPKIMIEVELALDSSSKKAEFFYGEVYGERKSQQEKYGIRFECKIDEELSPELDIYILDGKIPYEYYILTWETFAGRPYKMVRRPINFISIDTSFGNATATFNYYNRALFSSKYDEKTRMQAKNIFRDELNQAFEKTDLPKIDENRQFGIDHKKVVLENVLSLYENSIPLENRGSGMESLIKTKIALNKVNGIEVILMEEPENHLSFSTLRKMLHEISEQQEKSQIIVATHSNLIASRLNLKNVLWVTDNEVKSLNNVDDGIANFFVKADDNSFLQLLLSKKAILVEGATEFLLLPYFYQKITGSTLEKDGITIISCKGISYKNYLSIAEATSKKIAVLTDNDQKTERITRAQDFNKSNSTQHIFMSDNIKDWTWEVCIYKENKSLLNRLIKVQTDATYLFHGEDYGPVLGKMLNNKVDSAYTMLMSKENFVAPLYVKEAIEWIKE